MPRPRWAAPTSVTRTIATAPSVPRATFCPADEWVYGPSGNDSLVGGAGNDTLAGNNFSDPSVDSGIDNVSGKEGGDPIYVNDSHASDSADGGADVSGDTCVAATQ